MSEIITTNSLPLVSVIDSDDALLTAKGKRITENNLKAYGLRRDIDETPQWIRAVRFSGNYATGVFTIGNSWYHNWPSMMVIAYQFPSSQLDAAIGTRLNVLVGSNVVFTKARIVYPAVKSGAVQPCYLEFYHSKNEKAIIVSEHIRSNNATIVNEPGSIPEGYTSMEMNLSSVGAEFRGGG